MADKDNSSNAKQNAPVNKQVPFGTKSEKYAFSSFTHLGKDDKNFALDLAITEPPENKFVTAVIKEVKESSNKSKVVLKAGELKELLGQGEEGIEPCTRKECVTIVRKILETQQRNKAERNDILATEDMLMHEITSAEQDSTMLEEELAVANQESKRLELTLSHLKEQLAKLTKTCKDLQHERDEFSNKVMVIETDRQRWVRKLQLADAALQDCIWRGVSSVNEQELHSDEHTIAKSLVIKQAPASEIKEAESVCGTDYKNMVKQGMLDVTEYPTTATTDLSDAGAFKTLPMFVQKQVLEASGSNNSIRSMAKTTGSYFSSSQSVDGNASVISALTAGSAASHNFKHFKRTATAGAANSRFFLSQTKSKSAGAAGSRKLPKLMNSSSGTISSRSLKSAKSLRSGTFGAHTNPMDGSILLDLPPGTYKGYTPSGSPINRRGGSLASNPMARAGTASLAQGSRDCSSSSIRFSADTGMPGERENDAGLGMHEDSSQQQLDAMEDVDSSMEFGSELPTRNTTLAPEFYSERARTRWGRNQKCGTLVVRSTDADNTYHGNRRKLLTSLGHPGVFGHK